MKKKNYAFTTLLQRMMLLLLFCFGSMSLMYAQIIIKGKVVDESNITLPGVNVMIKGASKGTISDINGNFSIEVPNEKTVLRFTYIGYTPIEITVGNQKQLSVILTESTQNLEEVIVIGYGTQKKSHLTGSISKIKEESLSDIPASRLDQALQGKIAGVSIQNTTSEAGAAPQIRVRGMGSISASNEPLVVVDGYPVVDGLSFVDMNDVESIEILKDAASSAIYGSRGANGVILITTKSGNINKPKYSVKGYTGFKSAYKLHDIMSAQEYVNMMKDEQAKGGRALTTTERSWGCIDNYTDWQKEALRDVATIKNVQMSISGGKKELKYYISGSYTSDEGIMINSEYEKFSMRTKLDASLTKNVKVGINFSPSYTKKESPATGFIDFYRTYSWLPVRHTVATSAITGQPIGSYAHGRHFNDRSYTDPETEEVFTASPWGTANNNPRAVMDNEKRYTEDYRATTSAYLTIELAKGLEFKTSNGFYFNLQEYNLYHNANAKSDGDANFAIYRNKAYLDLLTENMLTYNKTLGKHDFSGLLGYTANISTTNRTGIKGTGFPTDYIPTINAATSIEINDATSGDRVTYTIKEKEALVSFLGRLNYNYDGKYLFSGSLRTDGSSKFGPENQYGWFPSLSLGWRASEEGFLKELNVIDQLKFRGSWGVTGNNDIPNYAAIDKLNAANYIFGTGSGTLGAGLANTSAVLGNKAISWEQTDEFNIGFDFSIVKNRINLTFDYYYSITKSLLYSESALAITGYNQFWNNIGKVRNKGVEIELNTYNIKNKNFEWQTTFNFAKNDNRLLELSNGQAQLISKGERSEQYIAIVGQPAIQYYGYKVIGIWQTADEIAAGPVYKEGKIVVPGSLKVEDHDGNNVIDAEDRQVLGNPFANFTWGMTNTIKWRDFDFSVLLQGVQGVTVFNGDGYYQETKKINKAFTTNRWISPDYPGDGKTPNFADGNGMFWEYTDYLLEDGSYMSVRDISLGYKLPNKLAKKIGIGSLRIYGSGQNLLYIMADSYRGVNPEARYTSSAYASPLISGYQRGAFPLQRTITIGAEINF
jgi:TonB-linked SusC/RagA family outer membrane protein